MTYYGIEDFKQGIDLRKSRITAPSGTLRRLDNAHVTQGGEIEKRRQFVQLGSVPQTTFGLLQLNGKLFTVRRAGDGGDVAGPISVIDLPMPDDAQIAKISDWDLFNGKVYVVVMDTAGRACHFYDGVYVPDGKGVYVRTYKGKMYAIDGRTLRFSAVGDPTVWNDPAPDSEGNVAHNGSGYIDVGANDADSEYLLAMEVYYDKLALFSNLCVQLWFLDPDPSKNTYYQTLRDAGTIAPHSVRQFTASDVYFLGPHGFRSLRARDMTLTAAVSDNGSPLDNAFIQLGVKRGYDYLAKAICVLSIRTGRVWVILPDEIFVLSSYQSPQITAWGRYDTPGPVTDACYSDPEVCLRTSDGKVWTYTGTDPDPYDDSEVVVQFPFLTFEKPCVTKAFTGLDVACSGQWDVYMSLDPANPAIEQKVAVIDGPTFLGGRIPLAGFSTHISLKFVSKSAGPATLSKVFIHYKDGDSG